jgi:hypothetical protein
MFTGTNQNDFSRAVLLYRTPVSLAENHDKKQGSPTGGYRGKYR